MDEEYMAFLTTCSLEKLSKEPEALLSNLDAVSTEMKSTVVKDYRSFIQASKCITQLHSSMDNLTISLKTLTTSLSPLPSSCEQFSQDSVPLKKDRNKNKLALAKYDKMLDLLKVPRLMEKRVKKGAYEDGLQIQQFAKQLAKKHPTISIIQSLANDVKKQENQMRGQLHGNLKQNIKVHQCLENISYLRRLEVYSDTELRIIFLKSRDSWFHSQTERLVTTNAYTYLSKLIDLTRDHLYDVITQYRIIFASTSVESNVDGKNESSILSSWIIHQIKLFVGQLERFIGRINEGSSIRNIMDFSLSISRVGVDLSGFLPPIFEKHVIRMFSGFLQSAVQSFAESIKSDITSATKGRNPLGLERRDSFAPSRVLLDLPPLAILTNSFVHAFNELRQCAIITIRPQLATIISNSLNEISKLIRAEKQLSRSSRQADFAYLTQVCSEHFFPYIEKLFGAVYHSSVPLLTVNPI